jgi:urease accessory protein
LIVVGALHASVMGERLDYFALPFVALGVLAGQRGARAHPVVFVFALCLAIGACFALWTKSMSGVAALNIVSCVIFGGLIASAWQLPIPLLYAIGIVFGLTHGFANGEAITREIRPYLFIPGVAAAGAAVAVYGMIVTDYLLRQKPTWLPIAVRVAGSWIAAIGILVLAISGKAILKA